MPSALAERCFLAGVTIERILNLDTQVVGADSLADAVVEAVIDNDPAREVLVTSGFAIPSWADAEWLRSEAGWVFDRGGWLVEARTRGKRWWTGRWFYASTFEDAVGAACEWADGQETE